jgi:hypothetical protein
MAWHLGQGDSPVGEVALASAQLSGAPRGRLIAVPEVCQAQPLLLLGELAAADTGRTVLQGWTAPS